MTEGEQQRLFAKLVGVLINWIYQQPNLEVSFGEVWRPPEMAKIYAEEGKGIANSLHTEKLAVDLNLFVNGVYREDAQAYGPIGQYWKSLHPLCRWGGDFKTVDADHFSMEWHGVK